MKINNNIQALNAYRNLYQNQNNTSKNLEKLSSGLRINRASDDAAGLAISEKMRSQIRGLKQAERNALDGISLIQTAEGAMQEMHSMLQRMRELSVQGANGTYSDEDLGHIMKEMEQLIEEINGISEKTQFNNKNLLSPSRVSENPIVPVDPEVGEVEDIENGAGEDLVIPGEGPTEPTEDPEVPGEGPTEPTEDPEVPGEDPTEPIEDPEVPGEDPTEPIEDPEVPGEDPTEPIEDPEVPGEDPTEPVEDPEVPGEDLTEPVEDPVVPGEDPVVNPVDTDDFSFVFQIGPNQGQSVKINMVKLNSTELGLNDLIVDGKISEMAISKLDSAINTVSNARATLGAAQNRLDHTINNLQVTHENLSSSESRIRDADMALEMTEFTRNNILNQSATAMLAQANQLPQGVLQLLQ
ncbi:flagellin [Litchfieldia alkalitelluris]|uniref:flagellin N-terminal helical domain-containing protein n=1 Tax=Litchfieldia alkalitelluris TaxID=304268 RepID=UPI001F161432|nr:flagellin [Litchfieldia alkalitelluris]